jgi:3-phenylpropionate/trans-cinnamate dioxygenase ferredoxin reductase subunit
MDRSSKIAIIGAGAAGLAAAETLRLEKFGGQVVMFGDEGQLPYNRPPLSKHVLSGRWEMERTQLRTDAHYADLGIALELSRAVTGLDAEDLRIIFADGSDARFDGIIVCTGVRPRELPFGHDLAGVHVLRTGRDVAALRADLRNAARVVVIGAGFLGTEAAATASGLGLDVTVVESMEVPLLRQLGPTLGARVGELHRQQGVRMLTGVAVQGLAGSCGRVRGVQLSGGQELPADVVLVTIGSAPAVGWLAGSGLRTDDGVICDEFCCAAPGIYAAGDVAAWYNPRYGRLMRVEHRINATEQATVAARNLIHGDVTPFDSIPYFWSDQFDTSLHAFGLLPADADLEFCDGELHEDRFVVKYRVQGQVYGVLGWNWAKQARQHRASLDTSAVQSRERSAAVNGTHT